MMNGKTKTDIEYARHGDVSLTLDAFTPAGDGPRPAVIYLHGGGWCSGDKRDDFDTVLKPVADAGFAWFSANYRLAPAHRWPACLDDTIDVVRWVKTHAREYNADADRIILAGYSAGGKLAALATSVANENNDVSARVQGVIGISPPSDHEFDLEQRGGLSQSLQALLDRPKEVTEEALIKIREMSPVHHVKPGLPPFLFVQGEVDKTVQLEQTRAYASKLRDAKVPSEIIVVKGAPHRLAIWSDSDPTWTPRMIEWLKKHFPAR